MYPRSSISGKTPKA